MRKDIYKRHCDRCGRYYEGQGKHFCSRLCGGYGRPIEDRFWEKVNKTDNPDECWIWKAGKTVDGYGSFRIGDKNERAHRVSWELMFGKIPDGKILHHICNNTNCVNYNHLVLSTIFENIIERDKAGRQAHLQGELNGYAKLTGDDIIKIKLLLQNNRTNISIAKEFGVDRSNISLIKLNKTWKHIQ